MFFLFVSTGFAVSIVSCLSFSFFDLDLDAADMLPSGQCITSLLHAAQKTTNFCQFAIVFAMF